MRSSHTVKTMHRTRPDGYEAARRVVSAGAGLVTRGLLELPYALAPSVVGEPSALFGGRTINGRMELTNISPARM